MMPFYATLEADNGDRIAEKFPYEGEVIVLSVNEGVCLVARKDGKLVYTNIKKLSFKKMVETEVYYNALR